LWFGASVGSETDFCEAQPKNAIANPHPNLEMIASKLACFIKQTNIFIQRKMIQANNSAMCIGIYHIAHARTAS
jgi:hypothetical protein